MNLILRAIELKDLEALNAVENEQDSYLTSDNYLPFSKDILEKYISGEHDLFKFNQYRYSIDCDGNAVGFLDLFDYNPVHARAGVGIYILKNYRSMGFAYTSIELLKELCVSKLNIDYLHASISDTNHHSKELFEKLGFVLIGQRKGWLKHKGERVTVSLYENLLV